MQRIKGFLGEILTYKSALVGLIIIFSLVALSIYTIATIPYEKATKLWNAGETIWLENPRNAMPKWVNLFLSKKLPETIIINSEKDQRGVTKIVIPVTERISRIRIELSFKYEYDDFPSEINLFFNVRYNKTPPHIAIYWVKPNGEKFKLKELYVKRSGAYYISIDEELSKELHTYLSEKVGKEIEYAISPEIALFAVEDETIVHRDTVKPLKGRYKVIIDGILFGNNSNLDVKLVVYGKVYGIAGTDHLRRDLSIALLWGTPIALSFGVIASVVTALLQMVIAAISAWYGSVTDFFIQRLTEIFMVLPFLPILMMISYFYKINIWVLLLVVIALSIFGAGIKNYRAMFLQIKEFPYVEAARAYGASNLRIVFRYLIPKVLPTIIPSIVYSVPSFVFLEAALALLGLGDPLAPTWGKVLDDALENGALYKGYYYWVLEPSFLLVLTAFGFAMLGFALDKIFNPRLREM
ncbi:MAG: ABC transporter permease [Thermoprotei archaeon]|nr:MAG: ABC transporter permease [Thermoprotei archaeon]RLF20696.1 MAG: ABC transporter permease [Thermoprotei archaeon]